MGQTAFFASPIPPSFDLPTVKWGSLIKWNVSLYGFIFLRRPPTPPVTYQPVFHNMNHLPACNSLFQCFQTLSPFLMLEVSRELQSATCKVKFTHPAGLSSASLRLMLNFLSFFYQGHRCVKWKSNTKCSRKNTRTNLAQTMGYNHWKNNREF